MNPTPRNSARRGTAGVEFAILAPLAILLMLAAADIVAFFRIQLTIDQAASGLGNAIGQYSQLYEGDFSTLFSAGAAMAGSTAVTGASGQTVLSGIVNSGNGPLIAWQRSSAGGSGFVSRLGGEGAVPALPDAYVVPVGKTVIVAEIMTQADPWVFSVHVMPTSGVSAQWAYAVIQPRFASLATVTPGSRP